jgi:hypothetical protein
MIHFVVVPLQAWPFSSSFLLPHYQISVLFSFNRLAQNSTHPSTCISSPIPSSLPSNLYPLPHSTQCVKPLPCFSSCPSASSLSNILYNGGRRGKGRFRSRREKTKAGRLAIAGDIDGSRSIRIGLRAGRVLVRYPRKGARAGFS